MSLIVFQTGFTFISYSEFDFSVYKSFGERKKGGLIRCNFFFNFMVLVDELLHRFFEHFRFRYSILQHFRISLQANPFQVIEQIVEGKLTISRR